MTAILEFEFEELPLVIENGFEAGLVSGAADISYHHNREWFVRSIYLTGYRTVDGKQETRLVEIDGDTELYLNIWDTLCREGRLADRIQAKVDDALEWGGDAAADKADHDIKLMQETA